MPGSRTAWRMTLKGSCPGSVQSSWAFRKVVHFFCSSLSPPTSFYGRGRSQGAAPRPSPLPLVARLSAPPPPPLHWLLNGQPRPRPPEAHLADAGHTRRAELVEELKLAGRLLKEEVDDLGRRDGGDEGGVRCGGGQQGLAIEHLGAPCCKPWGWLPRPGEGRPRVPPLVEGGHGGWAERTGRRTLHEDGPVSLPAVPQCLEHSTRSTLGSQADRQLSGSRKGQPALGGARELTLQPAEESVGLEDGLGSQSADQDGLAAQEVVHGARVERPVWGVER